MKIDFINDEGVRLRIINPEAIPTLQRKIAEFIIKYDPEFAAKVKNN